MSITELPKIELKSIENIKFDEYLVKIDEKETDKKLKKLQKTNPILKRLQMMLKQKKVI